ncbi:hypothetical protein PVK06_035050 [Gossypium arboreum]|uniref:Uncharacterized protein n=1 Tax=Gossypium arboreum TaxID=29729 RepID=A0ABR0NGZ6_GOSAR|nr:hypothetical protein PVK06_035050 [Gossypium arboreum]
MLVGGIAATNKNGIDQHAVDTVCALNSNSAFAGKVSLKVMVFSGVCEKSDAKVMVFRGVCRKSTAKDHGL